MKGTDLYELVKFVGCLNSSDSTLAQLLKDLTILLSCVGAGSYPGYIWLPRCSNRLILKVCLWIKPVAPLAPVGLRVSMKHKKQHTLQPWARTSLSFPCSLFRKAVVSESSHKRLGGKMEWKEGTRGVRATNSAFFFFTTNDVMIPSWSV